MKGLAFLTNGVSFPAFSGDEDYCYKIVADTVTWYDARSACEAEEGRLASIHNPSENTFVTLKIKANDITEAWTGLNDLNLENSFEWIDSSPSDFFNWGKDGKATCSSS